MSDDLAYANAAALEMVDRLPLHALLSLQSSMAATINKYASMGVGIPPRNALLKAKVEQRIAELRQGAP